MDLAEFESMKKLIDDQDKAIKELQKGDQVVLVDYRGLWMHSSRYHNAMQVPKVSSTNTELAKSLLQKEFDELFGLFVKIEDDHNKDLYREFPTQKKGWFNWF